jgi:hypothetical protein
VRAINLPICRKVEQEQAKEVAKKLWKVNLELLIYGDWAWLTNICSSTPDHQLNLTPKKVPCIM